MHSTGCLLPRSRHPLACLRSDKALMESNMRTVLTPASLIYQDYWHLQKQVVCLDEMFPRRKEKKKKIWLDDLCSCSILMSLVLPLSGATTRGILSAGGARCSRQVSVPSPITSSNAFISLGGNANKPTLSAFLALTFLTTLSPLRLPLSPLPHLEGHPICFLLGVHFQSAGWWNSEFRPPRVMRVLGLLKVPWRGPCHLPLLPSLCPTCPCAITCWSPHLFSIPCSFELLWENGSSHQRPGS